MARSVTLSGDTVFYDFRDVVVLQRQKRYDGQPVVAARFASSVLTTFVDLETLNVLEQLRADPAFFVSQPDDLGVVTAVRLSAITFVRLPSSASRDPGTIKLHFGGSEASFDRVALSDLVDLLDARFQQPEMCPPPPSQLGAAYGNIKALARADFD
jgi:hypothetical protein